jgi:DNA-binding response OmpR family regulator
MPGVDGRSVLQHIRSSKRYATPVIGVSGTPWLLQGGQFDDVLHKPFAIHTLIEKVTTLTRMPVPQQSTQPPMRASRPS